jgi:type II restriction/modification system DNA methylase subunit YeeA
MVERERYIKSLSYWQMGFYFLNLTIAVFKQTIKNGNSWTVIDDKPIDENKYNKKTEFSDFNIIVPTLFDLYHGFELVLKGFLLLKKDVNPDHKIEELYSDFIAEYSDQVGIKTILEKFIIKQSILEPIKTFVNKNQITANKFYEALRYPINLGKTHTYKHIELKYKSEEGIPFFQETVNKLTEIMPLFVKLGRSYEP